MASKCFHLCKYRDLYPYAHVYIMPVDLYMQRLLRNYIHTLINTYIYIYIYTHAGMHM